MKVRNKLREEKIKEFGYNDPRIVNQKTLPRGRKILAFSIAILFILSAWMFLNSKLLFGEDWISPTYDNERWKTNEGNLHTFGAWDIESHIWKSEFIVENFPNYKWNPYWYLGMPLLKYYQSGFYIVNILVYFTFGVSMARAALLAVIFGHLFAVLLTFLLCYKFSRRVFVSALASIFLLASTFVSLRSYGWEPITIVFLSLFPLGLLLFFREPLRPFRLSMVLLMAVAYLAHPLIFFSLSMTLGLYLFSIAIRKEEIKMENNRHYIWQYFGLVFTSVLIGAVQFFPQMSYDQVTSGAHMGVKYIPFYHVPFNIISIWDFLFDAGNLKGPGLVIMISLLLVIIYGLFEFFQKKKLNLDKRKSLFGNELVAGVLFVLGIMVLFYYMERYDLFPMNFLRYIQYHRIIPEFIVVASALVAALSNLNFTKRRKMIYYAVLIGFALSSFVIIYNIQTYWDTTEKISDSPEFIYDSFDGKISFPYTDQSLAVRNSFTEIPQAYGYYEQGITNAYADELFSVSSSFHPASTSLIYLKAANIKRLYINMDEGEYDKKTKELFDDLLEFNYNEGERYGYFEIPIYNPHMAQAVSYNNAMKVQNLSPGCRTIFKVEYCGSEKEEFVVKDKEELIYLENYISLLEEDYSSDATIESLNPEEYLISVKNAKEDTAIVVKMTHDSSFEASVNGNRINIEQFGPDYMLVHPNEEGDYQINLEYKTSKPVLYGMFVSLFFLIFTFIFFAFRKRISRNFNKKMFFKFNKGDMR